MLMIPTLNFIHSPVSSKWKFGEYIHADFREQIPFSIKCTTGQDLYGRKNTTPKIHGHFSLL